MERNWRTVSFIGAVGTALFAVPAMSQKAHVHGEGVLNIAVEADQVLMELEAPGADIVGFEHAPESDADKTAIAKAVATLEDGAALFQFSPDAQCALQDVDVEAPYGDDDHDEKHGHAEKHDDHAKHGDHAKEDEDAHSEFHAAYVFQCANPAALTEMTTSYFEKFSASQALEIRALLPDGQKAAELTADNPKFSF